jgi:DNA replication protein DnaC
MTIPINLVDQYLVELKLHGVRETLSIRAKQARDESMPPEDFLNLVLHDEAQFRKNARVQRLLKTASFRNNASLEGIDLTTPRGIDKKLINDLSRARFIEVGLNILIMGPTGVGKTHLATALGNAVCRQGHSTLFYPINFLVEKLLLARAQGNYLHLLRRLAAADLLIIDDFGI